MLGEREAGGWCVACAGLPWGLWGCRPGLPIRCGHCPCRQSTHWNECLSFRNGTQSTKGVAGPCVEGPPARSISRLLDMALELRQMAGAATGRAGK